VVARRRRTEQLMKKVKLKVVCRGHARYVRRKGACRCGREKATYKEYFR